MNRGRERKVHMIAHDKPEVTRSNSWKIYAFFITNDGSNLSFLHALSRTKGLPGSYHSRRKVAAKVMCPLPNVEACRFMNRGGWSASAVARKPSKSMRQLKS
jgi:hypothetical protein